MLDSAISVVTELPTNFLKRSTSLIISLYRLESYDLFESFSLALLVIIWFIEIVAGILYLAS